LGTRRGVRVCVDTAPALDSEPFIALARCGSDDVFVKLQAGNDMLNARSTALARTLRANADIVVITVSPENLDIEYSKSANSGYLIGIMPSSAYEGIHYS
jgi:hypothetical protein